MLLVARLPVRLFLVFSPCALAGCLDFGESLHGSPFQSAPEEKTVDTGVVDDELALEQPWGTAGGPTPQSAIFDQCRQTFPGIAQVTSENTTKYDPSGLDSSQQFATTGSGEWDDNANYRRFQKVVSTAPVHDTMDVSNRQFVVVIDEEGRGIGNCSLTLTDTAQTVARLTTLPSGRAAVFPGLYGLQGPVRVEAQCGSARGHGSLSLDAVDAVAKIVIHGSAPAPTKNSLDLAFVLDVTGSMSVEIEAMKQTIDAVATEIVATGASDVRLALVAFRDYGDLPEFEYFDFTGDLEDFRRRVASLVASGGGDTPEAVNEAVYWTTRLDWNPKATARMAFLIGDAPPHAWEGYSAATEAAVLACGGVKLFTVATTGQDPTGRFIFRQMSQVSNATHMFLLRDSAASNPECADYEFRTGELSKLVIERVKSELASQDADPFAIPGLGEDRDTEIGQALDECAAAASAAAGEELEPMVVK